MKKGGIYVGTVSNLDFPNKGVVELCDMEDWERLGDDDANRRIWIKNVLPGQKVRFQIIKKRKGKIEGRLLEVIQKASYENQEPFCKHFGGCGGCNYQSMDYHKQLELKKDQVKKLLDGIGGEYEFEGIEASPVVYAYRNKMEFSFGDEYKGGPLSLGLHKSGSFYDILPVMECGIVHGDFREILTSTLEYFKELGVGFYHKMRHEGYLRHLMIRRGTNTGEVLVNLVTSTQWTKNDISEKDVLDGYKEKNLGWHLEGDVCGVLHIQNDSLSDVVLSQKTNILYGRDYFYEEVLGLKFKITPFSFFQTNSLGAEVLYSKVREYIGEGRVNRIFDLYSGTGTIAQILAPIGKEVVGVEIVEEAVMAARENASLNGLENCKFITGDVLKVMDELEEKPDLIVLDPPRDGIHPKALKKIIAFGVERLVYVSCKPTSLARDLALFQEGGYQSRKAVCVDMFPWCRHVETVVLLYR